MDSATAPARRTRPGTIATLVRDSAAEYGDRTAIRYKRDGTWHERSYSEVLGIVNEIGLGLIDLGLAAGRAHLHSRQHPRGVDALRLRGDIGGPGRGPDLPDQLARGVRVGDLRLRRQRNHLRGRRAAREGDRDSRARAGDQDGRRDRRTRRRRARRDRRWPTFASAAAGATSPSSKRAATRSPRTTRSPTSTPRARPATRRAACSRTATTHRCSRWSSRPQTSHEDALIYLYLPLAHAYALLIQLLSFRLGAELAFFGGDTKQIVAELMEVKPTYLPSVPRIFEKIYTLARAAIDAKPPQEREQADAAIALGAKVRLMQARGEAVPAELHEPFEQCRRRAVRRTSAPCSAAAAHARRAAPRRSPRRSSNSSSPAAIPVLEGYGMTETATAATFSTPAEFKYGTRRPAAARASRSRSPTTARS